MFKHVVAPNGFQRCGGKTALRRHLLGDRHYEQIAVPEPNTPVTVIRKTLTASLEDILKEKK